MNSVKIFYLLLLIIPFCGCRASAPPPPPAEFYYLNSQTPLSSVGRVALVELLNDSAFPKISPDVTDALFQALQKKQVFGLSVISAAHPDWHSLNQKLHSEYTTAQLAEVRAALKSDAVLFGAVTGYQPYPHLSIGLRLKLIDLQDGRLLWALEQVWDSADKTTEYRIEKYFKQQMRSGFAPLKEELVAVSPIEFNRFVAYEVAETLQPK
jgi:hypothetical protein